MKHITIYSKTHGTHVVLVDDNDYDLVIQFKWFIYRCTFKGKKARTFYAIARIKNVMTRMHRLIMDAHNPKILIDHKDHNGLNNQRDNLRLANAKQNQFNMRPHVNNKTGFKGVSYHKGDKMYMVFMKVNDKNTYFGSYKTPVDAAKRYNELARQYHGEFAYQNPV